MPAQLVYFIALARENPTLPILVILNAAGDPDVNQPYAMRVEVKAPIGELRWSVTASPFRQGGVVDFLNISFWLDKSPPARYT
jgi:hypothetical protein